MPHGYRRIGGRLEGANFASLGPRFVAHNMARGIQGPAKLCIMDVGCSIFCGVGNQPSAATSSTANGPSPSHPYPEILEKEGIDW